ncbi:zinc ribbon domain-containing protein [Beduini massiliensis]|uniref:zinc ribbon domain-containing protein n=1 Tax=Beduini massiliensis TaxID=1585974 RepID=UPI00059A9357|nr:zinc ribbon domain-containing protein [Beduini massiliensis]
MAKYCERCGSRLKKGKCPVCDEDLYTSLEDRRFSFKKRDIVWFIVLALILGTSILCSESSPFHEDIQIFVWSNFNSKQKVLTKVDRRTYKEVTYSLQKTGDSVELVLPAGNYTVGQDIPEGVYKVTNLSGFGPLKVNDTVNFITIFTSMISDKETSDYFSSYLEDVRLYQGAQVTISTDEMKFESKNARNDLMQKRPKNTLTQEFTISSPVMIGETIPEGTYDIIAIEGEGRVSSENYEYGIHEELSFNEDDYTVQTFKNVQLIKYNKLNVDEGLTIKLIPSEYSIREVE